MTAAPAAGVRQSVTTRRVLVGLLLAILGIGSVFWEPAFLVLCTAIALCCLWEFAQLAAGSFGYLKERRDIARARQKLAAIAPGQVGESL